MVGPWFFHGWALISVILSFYLSFLDIFVPLLTVRLSLVDAFLYYAFGICWVNFFNFQIGLVSHGSYLILGRANDPVKVVHEASA